jgi:putative acetyltransferase
MTIIRIEQPADSKAIAELTRRAFLTAEHTCHTEQFIAAALRRCGQLTLSLVAERQAQLVGHVACSPLTVANGDAGWYGVGPLAVLPEYQRQGIGTLLMQQGMATLAKMGARGCVLVGDPAFYARLGFSRCADLSLAGVPPEYLLGKAFGHAMPRGEVGFSPAFAATS